MPGGTGGASGSSNLGSGGTGGTTSSPVGGVCWVDPADQAGQIEGLLERVARIEEVLSLLCGMDITAIELEDIASQAGVLSGAAATISNASLGWTNTIPPPAGMSLSTLGYTMSDGSSFPVVVMDENGVLQFGFGGVSADGTPIPIAGQMASNTNFAILTTNNPIRDFTTSNGVDLATITIHFDPNNIVELITSQRFAVTTSGWYLLTVTSTLHCYNDASGDGESWLRWHLTGNTSHYDLQYEEGPSLYVDANGNASHSHQMSASRLMYISSGAYSEISGFTSNGGGTPTMKVGFATITLQLLIPDASP
jgi:hypothetical protein